MATKTTKKVNEVKNTKKAAAEKAPKKDLSIIEVNSIASKLLLEHGTTSKIKTISASLRDTYGAKDWARIWACVKGMRQAAIKDTMDNVRMAYLAYDAALESEYKRLIKCAKWGQVEDYARARWDSGKAFIAACYPHLIDDKPARLTSYAWTNSEGDCVGILKAYEAAPRDARQAAADIVRALACLKTALNADIRKSDSTTAIKCSKIEAAGAIVAVYKAIKDDNGIYKAGQLDKDAAAKMIGLHVDAYPKLSEFNGNLAN